MGRSVTTTAPGRPGPRGEWPWTAASCARSGTVGCVATPDPRSIRIGNAEREQAVTALGEHFAQGRLNPEEFEERMTAAYAARTAHDLDRLFDDLPPVSGPCPTGPFPTAQFPPAPFPTGQYPTGPFPVVPYPTGSYPAGLPPPAWPGRAPHPGTAGYPVPYGDYDPQAPYGRDPVSGFPYSDRSKVVAGLLQLFLPIGIGRLYAGHTGIGIAQLLLTLFFGIGVIWAFIDGIVILAGRPTDGNGRPLRP
jgi:TM2 domain-containing membrane protein YozV